MRSIETVVWVLPHPTPYNIYLLNTLQKSLRVRVECIYRWDALASHPWAALPHRNFRYRNIDPPGTRDLGLEQLAESDVSVLLIFAGWRDRTIFPALVKRWLRRLPHAFWSDTPKIGRGLLRRVINASQVFFSRRAIAILATGEPAISNYRAMGIPQSKLKNFPFIVDPLHFGKAVAIRSERPPTARVTFVLPARLQDELKGQRVAIDAIADAKRRNPGAEMRLILSGVGPDESELRNHAIQAGVSHEVEFRGWVEYEGMPDLLGSADALVIPSHWDPYPVAVIEAMAAGLPVLGSSACGSVLERVEPGRNGFIHRPGDWLELSAHMQRIAESQSLRERMSANALARSRDSGIESAVATVETLIDAADAELARRK